MDDLISLAIMKGVVPLCFEESRIMQDWLRALDLGLIFHGIKDFINGESQWSEVLLRSEGLRVDLVRGQRAPAF